MELVHPLQQLQIQVELQVQIQVFQLLHLQAEEVVEDMMLHLDFLVDLAVEQELGMILLLGYLQGQ